MTLQAYADDQDVYFISNVKFAFLAGDPYYNASLRLANLTNIHFQGDNLSVEHPVRIIFLPGANFSFTTSYSITFSNLNFRMSESWNGADETFVSVKFENSSVHLSSLNIVGSKTNFP